MILELVADSQESCAVWADCTPASTAQSILLFLVDYLLKSSKELVVDA
jgi:hypothetical protein